MTILDAIQANLLSPAVLFFALGLLGAAALIWLISTAFIGLNMLQAGVTGVCPAAWIFKRFGLRSGCRLTYR